MLEIYSELKELLAGLCSGQQPATVGTYQATYIRFRGLVVDATEQDEVYQHWAQQYLIDVNDECGEVVKLHESLEEMRADIAAFVKLIKRTEAY